MSDKHKKFMVAPHQSPLFDRYRLVERGILYRFGSFYGYGRHDTDIVLAVVSMNMVNHCEYDQVGVSLKKPSVLLYGQESLTPLGYKFLERLVEGMTITLDAPEFNTIMNCIGLEREIQEKSKVRDNLIKYLKRTYAGKIGVS